MTTFSLTSGTYSEQTLLPFEMGVIGPNAVINADSAAGITGTGVVGGGIVTINALGSILSTNREAIKVDNTNLQLYVGANATLFSAAFSVQYSAVTIIGGTGQSEVVNYGTLQSQVYALYFSGSGGTAVFDMFNAGAIVGATGGARISSADSIDLTNTGDISSISGIGVYSAAVNSIRLVNSGEIHGDTYAIAAYAQTTTIINRGEVWGSVVTASGTDLIDNRFGQIEGGVDVSSGNDQLLNNGGTIIGDVMLGDGTDVLDNRGGTIFGTIDGGLGNDTFLLGLGIETINGGTGTDAIDFRGTPAVVVSLDDSLSATGHAVGDVYVSIETVYGSFFGDHIVGSTSVNNLRGYDGVDTIDGGAGNDVLSGGKGADVVTGGAGSDVFLFGALNEIGDVITDFSAGAGNDDVLQLRGSSLGGGLALGVLAAAAFQSRADNVAQDATDRFIFRTTDRTVWFDVDGNGSRGPVLVADLQAGAVFDRFDIVII